MRFCANASYFDGIQAETSVSLLSFYNFFSQFHTHIYVWEMHVISVGTKVPGVCKGNV